MWADKRFVTLLSGVLSGTGAERLQPGANAGIPVDRQLAADQLQRRDGHGPAVR